MLSNERLFNWQIIRNYNFLIAILISIQYMLKQSICESVRWVFLPQKCDDDLSLICRLCHPGPCPPCAVIVELACPCGRVVRRARCGDEPPEPCGAPCNRLHAVNGGRCAFGTHSCHLNCHDGDCAPCKKIIKSGTCIPLPTIHK